MALNRVGHGGLPEGADLIRGLVRKLGDEVNAPEANFGTPRTIETTKASVAKAIKIAKSPSFGRILGSFRKRFHAASARVSRDCKRAEVLRLAKEVANDQKVLPLSKSTVEGVAAALKEAGMKAGTQYLTELKLLHVEAGFEVEAWLKRTLDQCRKGLERDKGPTTQAVEVRVDSWESRRKGSPANPGLMFLWASIWMLREIEVRNMKIRDVLRNDKDRWTAIWLPTSKGDQQGSGIRRTLSCCGKARCEPHCPWKLAAKVMELAGDALGVSEDYLFKDARDKIITKRGVISSWKQLFDKGVTGHSPRRSGAMFYVRRGLPIQELAFLGRWKSSVVLTYAERVQTGTAIPMGIQNLETWLIFTDGACEGDVPSGSIGGVLVAPNHRVVHHFGCLAPDDVMSLLLAHSSHPIHELEMIPILVSFQLWRNLFQGCQVVHYIDNESVRMALLRGSGETPVARMVANSIMTAEFESRTKSWYARVASHSNIADAPSRLDFDQLNSLHSTFCRWTGTLCS